MKCCAKCDVQNIVGLSVCYIYICIHTFTWPALVIWLGILTSVDYIPINRGID